MFRKLNLFFLLCFLAFQGFAQGPILKTDWTDQVNPDSPLPDYPRPQLVRENWQNLNGRWNFAIQAKGVTPATIDQGKITVPFAAESLLSGVHKTVGPEAELWYERSFDLSLERGKNRILLHFGAVDWESEVWVNDKRVGMHQGGFDGFSFDVTQFLEKGKPRKSN